MSIIASKPARAASLPLLRSVRFHAILHLLAVSLLFPAASGLAQTQRPASQRYNIEASGGSVTFFAETGLFLILRAVALENGPQTPVEVEVTGPPNAQIFSPGEITLPGEGRFVAFYDLLGMAEPGPYTVRLKFEDATVERTFTLPETRTEVSTLVPRPVAFSDGSVRVEWNAIEGASSYWVEIYEQRPNDEGDFDFIRLFSGTPGNQLEWSLPAKSVAAGKTYVAAVYPLTLDVNAETLAPVFFGNTGSETFTLSDTPPPTLSGDLNADGQVDLRDATLSLQIAVGSVTPTAAQRTAGDFNGDSALDLKDTTAILRKAVGL